MRCYIYASCLEYVTRGNKRIGTGRGIRARDLLAMKIISAILQRWYDAQVMKRAAEKEAEDREQVELEWERENVP